MFYNNVANWSYVMSYLYPMKSSDASALIRQYNSAIKSLQTDPKTKDCSWVNSVVAKYKGYISQLRSNSVPDSEFNKQQANNRNSLNFIV